MHPPTVVFWYKAPVCANSNLQMFTMTRLNMIALVLTRNTSTCKQTSPSGPAQSDPGGPPQGLVLKLMEVQTKVDELHHCSFTLTRLRKLLADSADQILDWHGGSCWFV